MQTLGYGLVCLVCSVLSKTASSPTIVFDRIIAASSLTIVKNEVITRFFPKSAAYISNARQNKSSMFSEIFDLIDQMTDEDKKELSLYFSSVDNKKVKALDLSEFLFNPADFSEKELKKEFSRLEKEMKKLLKKMAKVTMNSLQIKNAHIIAAEIYGNDNPPKSVTDVISIINNHLYELKYLALGGEYQDLAKVVQFMIEDGNLRMMNELRQSFDIMAQHNSEYGERQYDINTIAKKDPFCFVRLECPECHASGSALVRKENKVSCKCCQNVYDIIKNIDDDNITKMIKECTNILGKQISSNEKAVIDKIEQVATKLVGEEYFEKQLKLLEENEEKFRKDIEKVIAANSSSNTVYSNSMYFDQSFRYLKEKDDEQRRMFEASVMDKIDRIAMGAKNTSYSNTSSPISYLDGVIEEIGNYNRHIYDKLDNIQSGFEEKTDKIISMLENYVNEYREDVSDAKSIMDGLFNQITLMQVNTSASNRTLFSKLEDFFKTMGGIAETKPVPITESAPAIYCPCCKESNIKFNQIGGGSHFSCSNCGYIIPSDAIASPMSIKNDIIDISALAKDFQGELGIFVRFDDWESEEMANEPDSTRHPIRLLLGQDTIGLWQNDYPMNVSRKVNNSNVINTSTLILVCNSSYCIGGDIVSKLKCTFPFLNKIVLGNGVEYNNDPAPAGWVIEGKNIEIKDLPKKGWNKNYYR